MSKTVIIITFGMLLLIIVGAQVIAIHSVPPITDVVKTNTINN